MYTDICENLRRSVSKYHCSYVCVIRYRCMCMCENLDISQSCMCVCVYVCMHVCMSVSVIVRLCMNVYEELEVVRQARNGLRACAYKTRFVIVHTRAYIYEPYICGYHYIDIYRSVRCQIFSILYINAYICKKLYQYGVEISRRY